MTKEQKIELKRYKSALIQYQLTKIFPFLSSFLKTNTGFCHHFDIYGYGPFVSFSLYLPTLYLFTPKYVMYWFPKGELAPRIEILKQAIYILKQQ